MTRSGLVALALAGCLLLAGCSAPAGSGPETTGPLTPVSETAVGPVEVVNGTLPVDENRTFRRVAGLVDARPDAPVVYVGSIRPLFGFGNRERSPFFRTFWLGTPNPRAETDRVTVGAATNAYGTVYIVPGSPPDDDEVERTLAHEYTHVAQFERGIYTSLESRAPEEYAGTTDSRMARRSLVEGAAVYVSSAYAERYLPDAETEAALLDSVYDDVSAATRYYWGPYRFGYEYVAARADSTAAHWSLYDEPPRTTEQVLHDESPETEPREPFAVTDRLPDAAITERDTKGELVTRTVLSSTLSPDRAADAAAGWAYDRAVTVERGRDRGIVWVHRLDDRAEATELRSAFRATLADRGDGAGTGWTTPNGTYRLLAPGDRTVVVAGGSDPILDGLSATVGDGGDVTIGTNGRG